jgi:hypothetical protein
MLVLRLGIGASMLVLMCGQILVWHRRDNVLAYLQVGTYLSTFAVPLFGTNLLASYDDHTRNIYVLILVLGALAFLPGLAYGACIGRRSADRLPLTFARPFSGDDRSRFVARRGRSLAVGAGFLLVAAYGLLGYVPLLAADSRSAKYGIGAYAAGFARGRILYLLALSVSSAILPVILVLYVRRRRPIDLVLAAGLELGLVCSLNRGLAFLGPLTFLVAYAIERRARVPVILAGVVFAFLSGIVFNQLTLPSGPQRPSFATLATISAPDLVDHLNFLRGYESTGRQENQGRFILSGLDPRGGEDGSSYALQVATGISDRSQVASGGLRLPAPVWGYSAFGVCGAVIWSFLSGMFAGWGGAKFRRLLGPSVDAEGQSLNLVLAVLAYNGSFALLEQFYFTSTSAFVLLALAIALGVYLRFPSVRVPAAGVHDTPGAAPPTPRQPSRAGA